MPGVALDVEAPADDPVGAGEGGVGIADGDLEGRRQVVAEMRMQERGAWRDGSLGDGTASIGGLDADGCRAIVGRRARLGKDRGDWLADVAHAAVRQDRLRTWPQRRMPDHGVNRSGTQVIQGDRVADTRDGARLGQLDRLQPRVRIFAAHEHGVQLAWQLEVLEEAGLTA